MIFVHIPRCGGTAFRGAVRASLGWDAYLNVYEREGKASLHVSQKPAIIGGHIPFSFFSHTLQHADHCVLLREPIDRLKSYYKFVKHPNNRLTYFANNLSFTDFCNVPEPDIDNGMVRLLGCVLPTVEVTEEHLENAKNAIDCSICGHTSELSDFVAEVSKALGIEIKPPPKVNTSSGDVVKMSLGDDEAIRKKQWADCELWRYYKGKDERKITKLLQEYKDLAKKVGRAPIDSENINVAYLNSEINTMRIELGMMNGKGERDG